MTETKTTTRRRIKKKITAKTTTEAPDAQAGVPSRPGGKLGNIVERLETTEGATLTELTDLTGWQPHTVRAALTRLRQRGFSIGLEERGDRKAYRITAGEG
jgi:hypothetical protein